MLLMALTLCLNFSTIAQSLIEARVIGTIPLGTTVYSIIHESNSDNTYKTSPHSIGALLTNQVVQIRQTENGSDQVEIIASSLTTTLYADLIIQEYNNQNSLPSFTELSIENDILFFEDRAHIAAVYDALTRFTDQSNIDEQLDIFQAEYPSYISFRQYIINKYNWINGRLNSQDLLNLYQEDFIADEIKKTFLNENRMVGVGDSIYFFHDLGEIYRFSKENVSLIGLLEDMDRDDEPFDPASPVFQHIL